MGAVGACAIRERPERSYALVTIVALAAWLSLVHLFWRRRLLERFLGVSEKQ
jgi:hypothetical protein